MSRQMKCVACVLSVVAIVLSAGMVQAETIVYSANADMYASETGTEASATFGVWSVGYRSTTEGVGSTAFHSAPYHYTTSPLAGWCYNSTVVSDVLVNSTGAPLANGANGEVYGTDVMHVHSGATGDGEYAVLRWTAPEAGTISVTTDMRMWTTVSENTGADGVDVHLVLNGASLYDKAIGQRNGLPVSAVANLADVAVIAGDTLDFVLGNGPSTLYSVDATAVYHAVTLVTVPEPCALMLLGSSLIGLLAYAWRRRK